MKTIELQPGIVNLGDVLGETLFKQLVGGARIELVLPGWRVTNPYELDLRIWQSSGKLHEGRYRPLEINTKPSYRSIRMRRVLAVPRGMTLKSYTLHGVMNGNGASMADAYADRVSDTATHLGVAVNRFFPSLSAHVPKPDTFLRGVCIRIRYVREGNVHRCFLHEYLNAEEVTALTADMRPRRPRLFVVATGLDGFPYLYEINAMNGDILDSVPFRHLLGFSVISMAFSRTRELLLFVVSDKEGRSTLHTWSPKVRKLVQIKGVVGESIRRVEVSRDDIFLSTTSGQLLELDCPPRGGWQVNPIDMVVWGRMAGILAGITAGRRPVYALADPDDETFIIGKPLNGKR